MGHLNEAIGNPSALLAERIFWLGLGGFFVLAIISSIIRGFKENNTKPVSPNELRNLAKKAIQQNNKTI